MRARTRAAPATGETFRLHLLQCYPEGCNIVIIPLWVWIATLVGVALVLTVDLFIIGRRPHEPSTKEAALWVSFYVSLACVFGIGVWLFSEPRYGGEFFAGWITEYSMSVDNLFVFMLIMASFAVPRKLQQKVLMIGIIMALVMRGIFILIGAELVNRFVWIFFVFGAFLIFTAIQIIRSANKEEDAPENALVRWSRRVLPVTEEYTPKGEIFTRVDGKRMVTPMLLVMIAIGSTDLLFAVDSIPATFGLTQEAYLVFTVNVFALMGLRQLYFLLGGLLKRLVYLNHGLAAILAFIGVKLVFHALEKNDLWFINNGAPVESVPHIDTWVSLGTIVAILLIATLASLLSSRTKDLPSQEQDAAGHADEAGHEELGHEKSGEVPAPSSQEESKAHRR